MAFGSESQKNNILRAIEQENRMRTSYGLQLLSAEDSMETHSYSFAGLSDVYEVFMMDMAGAAEIPATKLFGRSPQGMNSTGEADLRNYYDLIAQMQERHLRPVLEKLLPVMALSCWGFVPEDLEIVFEPVMSPSTTERADLVQKLTGDVIEAFKCGLLTREEALEELRTRGEKLGVYTKVEPGKRAEESPACCRGRGRRTCPPYFHSKMYNYSTLKCIVILLFFPYNVLG